jgi:LytS/YehU family sensor histidine kinase
MVDDYLGLEALRLADRLVVERDIDPAALTARVPVMLLQTLVENAIKHGIAPLKQGGRLRLVARRTDGALTISVVNSCSTDIAPDKGPEGIGLKNLSGRLRL